ncbi:MAG: 3-hydroxyacyl-CoA dehydrogenase family protein [Dehalococcoidales bacterium]|nr:3-hydroxyacyl-CoA dehydrogenase family protein [Dehalococcoidales bacterium]
MDVKTVTVLGASGTAGCNIAGIFASFGNARVYMVSRDKEKSRMATFKAAASVRAESILPNLVPADYSNIHESIASSDLIFESVTENLEIKQDVLRKIAPYIKEEAIVCTGTSGLSVNALAETLPENIRERFIGAHIFNPPYSRTLCELIPSKYTTPKLLDQIRKYLTDTLLRTVVQVHDLPAFLGNRIGFQFINQAMQYAEKYKYNGGIDYIDTILGPFTGRIMPPLATADFVGLDVHKAIIDNIYNHTSDYAHSTFKAPGFVDELITKGKLGRKTRGGLYKTEKDQNGASQTLVFDIDSREYRPVLSYKFPFAEAMIAHIREGEYQKATEVLVTNRSPEADICLGFLLRYIVYSFVAAEAVGCSIDDADSAMATGFNWCAPGALVDLLKTSTDITALLRERSEQENLPAQDIEHLLLAKQPSRYNYRPYFRAVE